MSVEEIIALLIEDEDLGVSLHEELKRQQAFSIEKYGRIALAEAPFVHLFVPAILAALDAAGWVCVPREPTNDMKLAGIGEFWDAPVAKVYRAMISSRPKP